MLHNQQAASRRLVPVSRKLVLVSGALLAAFLLGFVPQYRNARTARQELAAAREELARAQSRAGLAALRDLIALIHLEVSQRNYGLAAQQSTTFFDRVQSLAASETDTARKQAFQEILASRDAVTAGLANGDPAVVTEIQRLFRSVHSATASGG